jgi:hypothetical protein
VASYNTASVIDSIITQSKDSEFSRDLVLEYVQRTQDSVLGRQRFKFLEGTEEAILSEGDTTYDYDCDHQQIVRLILVDETTARPTVYQPNYVASADFFDSWPDPESANQSPAMSYTDYNGSFYFPAPLDKEYTIKIQYIARPKRLTDSTTSTPQIPLEYKDILVKGGLAGIEQFRENYDIAALHERRIEDLSDDMQGRYGTRKMGPGKSRTRGVSYGNAGTYQGTLGIGNGTF